MAGSPEFHAIIQGRLVQEVNDLKKLPPVAWLPPPAAGTLLSQLM
jgi:hypothetical protein